MLGDGAQAEEAAQDVFLKLYGARASYQPQSRFSTYLYRIATHHCWNLRARLDRKLVKRGIAVEEHADASRGAGDPVERLANDELRAALQSALHALPENQRAALLLVHHEGFSYREAAEVVEVSESAIKSLVHRARETLTEQLASFAQGGGVEVKH